MIANFKTIGTLAHRYFKSIKQGIFASFFNFRNNLISKVNRVNFVYMFVIPLCI